MTEAEKLENKTMKKFADKPIDLKQDFVDVDPVR